MESAPDKDFALFRSSRRLPEDPTYAVMRTLSQSMAAGFARHAFQELVALLASFVSASAIALAFFILIRRVVALFTNQ